MGQPVGEGKVVALGVVVREGAGVSVAVADGRMVRVGEAASEGAGVNWLIAGGAVGCTTRSGTFSEKANIKPPNTNALKTRADNAPIKIPFNPQKLLCIGYSAYGLGAADFIGACCSVRSF